MIDKKAKLNLDLMSCKNAASMLVKMMVTFLMGKTVSKPPPTSLQWFWVNFKSFLVHIKTWIFKTLHTQEANDLGSWFLSFPFKPKVTVLKNEYSLSFKSSTSRLNSEDFEKLRFFLENSVPRYFTYPYWSNRQGFHRLCFWNFGHYFVPLQSILYTQHSLNKEILHDQKILLPLLTSHRVH